jgi:hypothetical protein
MADDPTDTMVENQQSARERAESVENERSAEYSGSVETEGVDISEALDRL